MTRDRREGEAHLADLTFTVIDTAGLEQGDVASLSGRMRAQTEAAIEAADAVFFVIDARTGVTRPTGTSRNSCAGLTSQSSSSPTRLRASRAKPARWTRMNSALVNPCRFRLSTATALARSTKPCWPRCPKRQPNPPRWMKNAEKPLVLDDEEDGSELDITKPLRIAVVGRPNAGKSTLINRILGEERLLTGPEQASRAIP